MTTTNEEQLTQGDLLDELLHYARGALIAGVESVSDDHAVSYLKDCVEFLHPEVLEPAEFAAHWRGVALALTETAARLSLIAAASEVRPEHRADALDRVAGDLGLTARSWGWRPSRGSY